MSAALTDPAEIGGRESQRRRAPGALRRLAPDSWPLLIAVSLVLAAISLWVLPDQIGYDPYSWAIFGREIAHLHLDTRRAATAVKPLPMLFDTIFAFTGSHLPGLWLFAARVGDLLAFGAIFRLARRLGGVPAAVVAVAGFAASSQLLGYLFMRGMSEPMCAATMVAALDFFLLKRYRLALGCLIATAYLRPEAWPLLLIYLPWMAWRHGWFRRLIALAIAVFIPFSWFLIDWFGARQFNRSANAATKQSQGGPLLHHYPGLATFTETWSLASGPIVVLFLIGLVASIVVWWRAGHALNPTKMPLPVVISVLAVVWVAIDAVLAQGRFATGAIRYLLPAEALACVIVGWFVVGTVKWAFERQPRAVVRRRVVESIAAGLTIAVLMPALVSAERFWHDGAQDGRQYVDLTKRLSTAIRLAGGPEHVLNCGIVVTRTFQVPLVAWDLNVHLERIYIQVVSAPGVVFQQADIPRVPVELHDRFNLIADLGDNSLSDWRVLSSC